MIHFVIRPTQGLASTTYATRMIFKLVASRLCLPVVLFMVQVTHAQPLLPDPQAPSVGGVNASQMNLNVQIRDLCFVLGARDNQLVGYGLVVGLNNTGDKDTVYSKQSIANMLLRYGIRVPGAPDGTGVSSKNVAAVMIIADIPPFVKNGAKIDENR